MIQLNLNKPQVPTETVTVPKHTHQVSPVLEQEQIQVSVGKVATSPVKAATAQVATPTTSTTPAATVTAWVIQIGQLAHGTKGSKQAWLPVNDKGVVRYMTQQDAQNAMQAMWGYKVPNGAKPVQHTWKS